jgi:hypothetical protein
MTIKVISIYKLCDVVIKKINRITGSQSSKSFFHFYIIQ